MWAKNGFSAIIVSRNKFYDVKCNYFSGVALYNVVLIYHHVHYQNDPPWPKSHKTVVFPGSPAVLWSINTFEIFPEHGSNAALPHVAFQNYCLPSLYGFMRARLCAIWALGKFGWMCWFYLHPSGIIHWYWDNHHIAADVTLKINGKWVIYIY